MTHYIAIFFLAILIPMSFTSSFGVVYDFTTNASLYHKNDQLAISGNVSYDPENPFATIQIFNPGKSNFAYFWTLPVNSDGTFSHSLVVGGPTWNSDGIYSILITSNDGEKLEKPIEYKKLDTPPASNPTQTTNPKLTSEPKSSETLNQPSSISTQKIPSWIKTNAAWWADGKISDSVFVTGVEFMLDNKIIIVSNISSSKNTGNEIPPWIKTNAAWWSQDLISESEFKTSLKFLIQEGIFVIN